MHFVISTDPARRPDIDLRRITDAVRQTIRTWEDELAAGVLGGDEDVLDTAGERNRYREAFDEAYKENYSSATAVRDLHILDELSSPDDLALSMSPADQFGCNCRLKVYVAGSSVTCPGLCRCCRAWARWSSTRTRTRSPAATALRPGSTTSACSSRSATWPPTTGRAAAPPGPA